MLSLGVDVGSTNLKVALVEIEDGRAPRTRPRAVLAEPTPSVGSAVVDRALALVHAALEAVDTPPACVGIASMAETGVPLDADDRPLGDLVRWDLRRGQNDAEAVSRLLTAAALFRATGVRPSGKVPLVAWRHLRRTDSERWAALRRWAGAADLVGLALTGELVTDHTLAGRTGAYRLPDADGSMATTFDPDLLDVAGLRPEQLPRVATPDQPPPGTPAQVAGLPPGTPVVVAGHDHAVGAWAAGVRRPGDVADSVGTAEALVRVLGTRPDPDAVLSTGMSLGRTVAGDFDVLVAGSSSAGAMVATEEARLAAAGLLGPGRSFAALLEAAADRGGPAPAFLLPYLNGRQCPAPDPHACPRLFGPVTTDPVDRVGALLDGLCLHARWMHSAQCDLAGAPSDAPVRALGRPVAAGSPWLRVKAAVGPAALRTVAEPEPVAVGAALLAACRCGLIDPFAALSVRPVAEQPSTAYEPVYAAFLRAAVQEDAA